MSMSMNVTRWAQAALKMPGLGIVVIDTTGIRRDSDLLRALIVDQRNALQYHALVLSGRHPDQANTEWTGIEVSDLLAASSLQEIWGDLASAIEGRYLLAYGLEFVQDRLDENARQYGLPPITLIGADLHVKACEWFGLTAIKLVEACDRIGCRLPARPEAYTRASGQIALLNAMAKGRTQPAQPVKVEPIEIDEPFSSKFL